ncbi:amino acid adenylation domain-containing protein [Gordonia sp. VNK21]|uniref:amino acid adenylation domain-containing protein n=1 Tax=Gordonia sp. VNK21 TaxID=3382483 RepID=UPI0038D4E358
MKIADVLPLTPVQEGLLYASTLSDQGADPYTVQVQLHLTGRLDPALLQTAAQAVFDRHPNLRTCYRRRKNGMPVALVLDGARIGWAEHDLREAGDPRQEWAQLCEQDGRRRFDIANPPLLRLTVGRLGADDWRVLVTNHHLVLDGWSSPILLQEIFQTYAAGGDPAGLPARRPFRDFLSWLETREQEPALQRWRQVLGDDPAPTLLATDGDALGRRPEQRILDGFGDLHQRLAQRARAAGLTVGTLVQTAWGLALAGELGAVDVLLGATVSGRSPELDRSGEIIGMTLGAVPVRVSAGPARTVLEVARAVQQSQALVLDDHWVGLPAVAGAVGLGELFDTLLVFENHLREPGPVHAAAQAAGLALTEVAPRDSTHYPITVQVIPGEDLQIRLHHLPQAVPADRIDRLARGFAAALTALADRPETTVAELPTLSAAEAAALRDLGDGGPAAPERLPLGALPEQASGLLRGAGEEYGYAELDTRTRALTERLIRIGIGPESIVALAIPRSLDSVVAVLAVLRAGAAVLPVELSYPAEHVAFLLADAQPDLLIAEPSDGLPTDAPRLVIGAPDTDPQPAAAPVDRPVREANPAYLIYTSGSTGRPKGVLGTRRGLADRLAWAAQLWPPTGRDVRLVKSSFSFIDGLTELLGALQAGAGIVLADDAQRSDPIAQAQLLAEHRIGQVTAVPSLAAELAATAPRAVAEVQRWVLSGEALTGDVAAVLQPGEVINSYGSSEVAGDVTFGPVDPAGPGRAPIGTPVPGVVVHLLDPSLRPVPPGGIGEIYVASPQNARGYLGRPALTAESFVADPFGGGRLFRTRDLGRWDECGRLEFHGRVDGQVKIRGHRVETVGVEAVVREVAGVTGAAVVVRPDVAGAAGLWAYLTVDGSAPSPAGIRAELSRRLPEYSVPSILILDALPTLPNGKVDRRSLPDPAAAAAAARPAGRAASGATQELLAGLFGELLGGGPVNAETDFFAAGGHSLLATRLVHRLTVDAGVTLSVREIFDHPTLEQLAARIEAGATAEETGPSALATDRPDPLPATAAQRRLWALDRLHRDESGVGERAYNLVFVVELTGPVEIPALAAAVREVVDRHESLRTLLVSDDDGGLWQQILPPEDGAVLSVHDGPEAVAALEDPANRPFELDVEAPMRADLARIGDEHWTLQLVVHHIAGDEWSTPVLFDELADAYRRTLTGAGAAPARPVQYADAARWQEQVLAAEDADGRSLRERERDYWRGVLGGLPDELALPYDRPRPAYASGAGAAVTFELPATVADGLQRLARRTGTTGFMVAHAALAALWSRLTGADDIPIGTPVADRGHPELAAVIGMFTNSVVLRARVSGDPDFTALLARIREVDLAALDHQSLPFQEVVDVLDPPREAARSPLFQTMLQFRAPVPDPELAGAAAAVRYRETTTAKFDLTVDFKENGPGQPISGRIEYAADLFDHGTVARMAAALVRIFEAVTADPGLRVTQLPVLSATDREQLDGFAATAHPVDPQLDLTALIWATAQRHPEQLAVSGAGGELTYRELTDAADALAAALAGAGVGVDQVVAVDLPRSPALLVAVLAAGRAGAAYLPLDRDHPAQRRAFVLDDARPAAILTDDPDFAGTAAPVLRIDARGVLAGEAPAGTLPAPGTLPAGRAAYLIYTSGSTGTPKAVVVDHRAIVNRLQWMQDRFGLEPGERVLHKTPTGFDVSVWELFWPLLTGATVVLAEPGAHRDPAAIEQTLAEEQISTVHFVPSLLRAFLTETTAALPALRRILCSGEALTAPLRDGVAQRFPQVSLHNLYGPTEAAVDVTEIDVTATTGPVVPIGGPVWNTGLHVLGPRLEELPIGVWGELYLSGRQLARGYAGRYGLTATTFVACPFGAGGARMYRTGDIARWTADGVLEYAGRRDQQLKLRGQRIEPGEIEQALLGTGELRQAVALGHRTADGRTMLVAYAVPADGAAADPDRILERIAEVLPAHLVPATLTLLDELPVTGNGKLDRRALPDPVFSRGGGGTAGPGEQAVAAVFADVLAPGAEVGSGDDFFALGGDSIIAITVVNRLRRHGYAVTVKDLFEHRTVGAVAGAAVPVSAGGPADESRGDRPLPLTPIVAQLAARGGRWQSLAQSITVTVPDGVDAPELHTVLDAVLDRHEALRLQVQPGPGGVWVVRPQPAGAVRADEVLTVHRLDAPPDEAGYREIAAETQARLDPVAGGCLQAAAILAPGHRRLLLVIHHLAVDAVSWRILLEDLAEAAESVTAGRPPALAAPGTSYPAYTDALAAQAAAPETMRELARWRALLAGTVDPLAGAPAGTQADLAVHTLTLSPEATAGYLSAGSVTAALIADVAAAVKDWCSARDVPGAPLLVDVEGHGRDVADLDLARTVGWLTTVAPVRCEAGAAPEDLAGQLEGPRHGYGLLRYGNARTARVLGALPGARVLVNYLGALDLAGERPWQPAPEARWTRTTPAADLTVDYPLTVDARVQRDADGGARLTVELTYSGTAIPAGQAPELAGSLERRLDERGRMAAELCIG